MLQFLFCTVLHPLYKCIYINLQIWYQTFDNELRLANKLCLEINDVGFKKSFPRLMKCHNSRGIQEWTWFNSVSLLVLLNVLIFQIQTLQVCVGLTDLTDWLARQL